MRLLGRQFVTGRTIDEALDNAREREARGYTLFVRHAGRGGDDRRRRARATSPPTRTRSTRSAARPAARASSRAPASRSSSRRCIRATSRAQRERVLAELVPAGAAARAARARLRHRLQHRRRGSRPARAFARHLRSARRRIRRSRIGRGWASSCRRTRSARAHVIDWLVALAPPPSPPADGAARQGRVLGQRDQARAGGRAARTIRCSRARCTPTSPISPAPRRCSRRRTRSIRNSRATTRSRSPRSTRSPATRDYEFQCLHGMGESLYDQVVGKDKLDRRLPHLRAGRLARDAARVSRAPPARERRQHSFVNRIVDPAVSIAALVADPVAQARATAAARRTPRIPLPVALLPGSPQFARRRSRRRRDARAQLAAELAAASVAARRGADPRSTGARAPRSRRRSHSQSRGSRRCRRHRRSKPTIGDVARAVAHRGRRQGRAWSALAGGERAACLERAADLLEDERATFVALAVREAGKTVANAIAEVREAADFCATTPRRRARELAAPDARRSGRSSRIAPWNFPLAIFVGAGARGARRRQSGAREARRADAADRRTRRCASCIARACRRRRCNSCPDAARPSARRWSPIRASPA